MKATPFALAALALLALATTAALLPDAPPDREVARIRAHLATVERELLARDVSHLRPEQREARRRHVAVLREYRERGVFPHNHDFADERVPYFVDAHGTHCAVAYLVARSGRTDLVGRIAATRNHAYVPELADDPALVAWLDAAGISAAEAARIQPKYDYSRPVEEDEVGTGYAVASALSVGFGGAAIALNLPGSAEPRSRLRGAYGVLVGAYGLALGASRFEEDGAPRLLGVLNAAVGTASAVLGARTLWRAPGRPRGADVEAPSARVSVSPAVSAGSDPAVGLRVGVSF